jgi:IclR family transcriptional regulator, KDG regulon repressor
MEDRDLPARPKSHPEKQHLEKQHPERPHPEKRADNSPKTRPGESARSATRRHAKRAAGAGTVPPAAGEEEDRQRGGVQSIARAFAILEEVARNREGVALADLSKRVGLHNSTAFHLVKTMASLGYIRQIKDTKRYRIGRPLFALAAGALDEMEMVSMATPVLQQLSLESGESSHFAVPMNNAVVVLARTDGPGAFHLTERIGIVRPAWCTALGKIILAALRPDQLDRYLERTDLKPLTERTITDPKLFLREIEDVRRAEIAFDDGEFDPEVRCAAIAVRDFTGRTIGAIGISGPVWRLSIQGLQNRLRNLKEAAECLSAAFGARPLG